MSRKSLSYDILNNTAWRKHDCCNQNCCIWVVDLKIEPQIQMILPALLHDILINIDYMTFQ